MTSLLSRFDSTEKLYILPNASFRASGSNGVRLVRLPSPFWVKAWSFWCCRRSRCFLERRTLVSLERLIWSLAMLQMSSLLFISSYTLTRYEQEKNLLKKDYLGLGSICCASRAKSCTSSAPSTTGSPFVFSLLCTELFE